MIPGNVIETDVLILGGGIAGHRAAIAAREQGKQVTLVRLGSGASPFVLAFNVPLGHADSRDSEEIYYEDMLRGGGYLNEKRLVRCLVSEVETAMLELETIGARFARNGNLYAQRHLSGCTYPRSVYDTDGTGAKILQLLRAHSKKIGVQTWKGWNIVSLLKEGESVVGALAIKGNQYLSLRSKSVVLAMGGIGHIYEDSTYPWDVSASSYALAMNAGAKLIDMEFVQFEPTVVVYPEGCKGMEMPTAMLGDGATMQNAVGERFMLHYNPVYGEKRIDKASMALCIQKEIDEGRGFTDDSVLFDTTKLPVDVLEGYKNHCKRLRAAGLEPINEAPRVRPAAHSEMGGVYIDENGWTGVPGLYACGEAAGGVHGASRIAGNSGSDILVFGAKAGRSAAKVDTSSNIRDWNKTENAVLAYLESLMTQNGDINPMDLRTTLCKTMLKYVGLHRDAVGLAEGLKILKDIESNSNRLRISNLKEALAAIEVCNMTSVAKTIATAAQIRKESRGAHHRNDYPERSLEFGSKHISFQRDENGTINTKLVPIS